MKIPFTNYNVNLVKRGVQFLDSQNNPITLIEWSSGLKYYKPTPLLEVIYSTMASEFAKIDWTHIISKDKKFEKPTDHLNELLGLRPNKLQTKYDWMFTMMYQLCKYGNAITFIIRSPDGEILSFNPIDVSDYEMGKGYVINNQSVFIKLKRKSTNEIILMDYNDVIHLRSNPNDIFRGDIASVSSGMDSFIKVFDENLNAMLNELQDNGNVRGIITLNGGPTIGSLNAAVLKDDKEKINKQEEIVKRIKSTKGGILVLDAGETWTKLDSPFKTMTPSDIDSYVKFLYSFVGMNQKVIDGTAKEEEMEVFFNRSVMPKVENIKNELNFKLFSSDDRKLGHSIEYYRNPFEYVATTKALDSLYKGAMFFTKNEIRTSVFKLPPVEGGDELLNNLNFDTSEDKGKKGGEQH